MKFSLILCSLLTSLSFGWDWLYSPKYGGIWTKIQNHQLVSYIPDLGIKSFYKTLSQQPYCSKFKFYENKYKLIWDYPIKTAVFQCGPNTYIVIDEEIGSTCYLFREKSVKAPKSKSISFKGKREIIYGKWEGNGYFVPTYTYLIK